MSDDWTSKVVAVKGDIAEENLGLSDDNWELLQENVDIVFHSAATVRFDEDLKYVMQTLFINKKPISKYFNVATDKNFLLQVSKNFNLWHGFFPLE